MSTPPSIALGKLRGPATLQARSDGSIWRELGAVLAHTDGRIIVRPCSDASEADIGNLFAVAGWCLTDNYHLQDSRDWHPNLSAWASDIYQREPHSHAEHSTEELAQSRPAHQTT